MGFWDLKFGRGHFENCIRPFKNHQKWGHMIPNTISGIFQPGIDFSYGLDVEIRPKLTPGAGTSTPHGLPSNRDVPCRAVPRSGGSVPCQIPIAPPRWITVKQLGRVHFRPNLNIQPIKKLNGGSHLSARHQKSRFNLI